MLDRRAFLAWTALSVTAGCAGTEPEGTATSDTVTATPAQPTTAMPEGTEDLDLREANVVEVAFEGEPSESVRFEVTLFHDDDGEAGYANRWQVETVDGTRLGRRERLHAHSTAPFTRSTTVDVPSDAGCVVVRGHDQTQGYGGRAMLVNLDSGATAAFDQGPDRESVDPADYP